MAAKGVRVIALAGLAALAACRGEPPKAQTPTVDALAVDAVAPSPLDLPTVHVWLDDPRLSAARERERNKDYAGAAAELATAGARPELDARARCAIAYLEGRMRALASDAPGAADAFDRAGNVQGCALAPYAALRAAQQWGRQGKADEAIARANTALAGADPIALADDARLIVAESLSAKGRRAEALPLWRASLAANPKGPRWVDTSVRLANALLDGEGADAGVDAAAAAKEAYDAALRVEVEAPAWAEKADATAARVKAAAALHLPAELAPADRARRAQAWLDAGKLDKAHADASAALAGAKGDAALTCKLHTIQAQLAAKTKNGKAADAWGVAIASCAAADPKGDALAHALFAGGKASWSAKDQGEAIDRFARLEKELGEHRLADDARLLGALVRLERGEKDGFYAALEKTPDDYPKGDMKVEALFRAALQRLADKDAAAARATLLRAAPLDAGDVHWATAGRVGYFAARASELLGDLEAAKTGYAAVVREHPMAFYMFLAHARLAALDKARAKRTVDEGAAAESAGRWLTHEHDAMKKPAFARALALLEVGELDAARKELAASGATADGAEPELVWAVAMILDGAGAWEVGHNFSRARLTDHLAHWPEGRWRAAWEAAYPKAYEDVVRRAATERAIPVSLAWGIMREESAFIADVRSPTGALGLMQLMPKTAQEVARGTPLPFDEESLKRPDVNVALGTKLLGSSRASYGASSAVLAVPAYNAGPGAVSRWLASRPGAFDVWVESIPYEETRGYIKRVLASQGTYAWLYAKNELGEVLALPEKVP